MKLIIDLKTESSPILLPQQFALLDKLEIDYNTVGPSLLVKRNNLSAKFNFLIYDNKMNDILDVPLIAFTPASTTSPETWLVLSFEQFKCALHKELAHNFKDADYERVYKAFLNTLPSLLNDNNFLIKAANLINQSFFYPYNTKSNICFLELDGDKLNTFYPENKTLPTETFVDMLLTSLISRIV